MNIHDHLVRSISSRSFFCWQLSIAMPPVVRVRLGAWPSKMIRSYCCSSCKVIWFSCAPKMSGRFEERLSRLRRMSTSCPDCASCCPGFFLAPRQVLRCLFISEARMFWRQAWHCWRISLLRGSEMMRSSMVLGRGGACCWILVRSSLPERFLLWSTSKLMVSTSQKSFQSMLLSFACFAACSFFPRACCCFALWKSNTSLHRSRMPSPLAQLAHRSISSALISSMAVYAPTTARKQALFLEVDLRNSYCGLFFSLSLSATRKFFPFLATYCAVCWMMACSPSLSFSGSSATYFSGSGSFSSTKICSRKRACWRLGSSCSTTMGSGGAVCGCWGSGCWGSSSMMPCSIFLLTSATLWSQQARQGLSGFRKANSGLCCSRWIRIFSNSEPLWATCSAVFSRSSGVRARGTFDFAGGDDEANHELLQESGVGVV